MPKENEAYAVLAAQIAALQDQVEDLLTDTGDNTSNDDFMGAIPEWLDGGGGMDYDYLYVGTTKVTPPEKTTNFLKVMLESPYTCTWVGAMPVTQDSDSVVFDVTKNRIYLSGEFAG